MTTRKTTNVNSAIATKATAFESATVNRLASVKGAVALLTPDCGYEAPKGADGKALPSSHTLFDFYNILNNAFILVAAGEKVDTDYNSLNALKVGVRQQVKDAGLGAETRAKKATTKETKEQENQRVMRERDAAIKEVENLKAQVMPISKMTDINRLKSIMTECENRIRELDEQAKQAAEQAASKPTTTRKPRAKKVA
jgi:hypothetical protein